MKKILLVTVCVSLVIISLSIAYYFVIFLPQQQRINTATLKKIDQSTTNIEGNTQNTQPTTDTNNIQNQLDNINNTLQDQQRDTELQNNCESTGGKYQGSGVCVYSPR